MTATTLAWILFVFVSSPILLVNIAYAEATINPGANDASIAQDNAEDENDTSNGQELVQASIHAWEARQRFASRLQVEWNQSEHVPARALADPAFGDDVSMPPKDQDFTFRGCLLLDGVRMRYGCRQLDWTRRQGVYLTDYVAVCDGRDCYTYWSERVPPLARVEPGAFHDNVTLGDLVPIVLTFRLNDRRFSSFDTKSLTYSGTQTVDGHRCVILISGKSNKELRARLWVDPEAAFVVRRYERGTKVTFRTEIDYKRDEANPWLWIPQRWESTWELLPDRWVTVKSKVTKCVVGKEIAIHNFQEPEYVKGTVVKNSVTIDGRRTTIQHTVGTEKE